MSTQGHSSPLSAVEAFIHGQIDLISLEDALDSCCAKDEGAAWDALALLDQFHRRGRIADADFRVLIKRVNRYAQKPLGAPTIPHRTKAASARFRSTLTVPVGEDIPHGAPVGDAAPLQTQILRHPESLDLDLESGFDPDLAHPALDAGLDTEFARKTAPRTSELPGRVGPRAPQDAGRTILINGPLGTTPPVMFSQGRTEPTVMLDRADTELVPPRVERSGESSAPHSPTRSSEPTMHSGHRVLRDRFELGPLLGRGGMASVFQARDRHREGATEREQWVAVKILNEGVIRAEEGARALQREFQHVQVLNHPAIVKVLDFDYDGATPFLVMELIEGETLENMLARGERFSRRVALALVHHLAQALAYAHSHDIVHADFKPGNVMVMPSGQVKILDLGVSWRWQREPRIAALEGRASLLATPAYASQEVLNGGLPCVRDDIFSLGCLAYELLAGEHPFRRIAITKAVGQGLKPKRIAWLTRSQWRTLRSSLAWDRDARPASVAAFLDGLGLHGEPPVLQPPSTWSAPEASRLPMVIRVSIAAAACSLVALVVLPQWQRDTDASVLLTDGPPAVVADRTNSMDSASTEPSGEAESPTDAAPAEGTAPVASPTPQVTPPATTTSAPPKPAPIAQTPPSATAPAARSEPARDASGVTAPARPGRIAFVSQSFQVNERDALARIDLVRRQGTDGKVGVRWDTEDVTARKDVDYADMGEQMVWFESGQTRATLLVPLVVGGEVKDLRAFRVRIKDPEGGAQLAGATEAMVVISDD